VDFESSIENGVVVVAVAGRLDTLTTTQYVERIRELIAGEPTRLVLNFEGLSYISSAGLEGLLITAKLLKGSGGQLRIANMKGHVKTVFQIAKFDTIFNVQESVADAVATLE